MVRDIIEAAKRLNDAEILPPKNWRTYSRPDYKTNQDTPLKGGIKAWVLKFSPEKGARGI
jgi:hypothetical protein